jgi:hypothetical protein
LLGLIFEQIFNHEVFMSTLTGINADAVRLALTTMKKEVDYLYCEISRYCTGYESDITRLTMETTSGNRFLYTPEQLKAKSEELQACKVKILLEKEPREKRIEELRAKQLLVENLKTQSLEDMITITGAPATVITLMDQYLEEGSTIKDVFTGNPHYYV